MSLETDVAVHDFEIASAATARRSVGESEALDCGRVTEIVDCTAWGEALVCGLTGEVANCAAFGAAMVRGSVNETVGCAAGRVGTDVPLVSATAGCAPSNSALDGTSRMCSGVGTFAGVILLIASIALTVWAVVALCTGNAWDGSSDPATFDASLGAVS